jgi:hypothetical protein
VFGKLLNPSQEIISQENVPKTKGIQRNDIASTRKEEKIVCPEKILGPCPPPPQSREELA